MNKTWAYSIGGNPSTAELEQMLEEGKAFVQQWTAHENKLKASFSLAEGCVFLVEVDESVYGASGCSIDKLLRFIKGLEEKFRVKLLDRFLIPIEENGRFSVKSKEEILAGLRSGQYQADTLILNTAISDSNEQSGWKQSLKNSWLNRYLQS